MFDLTKSTRTRPVLLLFKKVLQFRFFFSPLCLQQLCFFASPVCISSIQRAFYVCSDLSPCIEWVYTLNNRRPKAQGPDGTLLRESPYVFLRDSPEIWTFFATPEAQINTGKAYQLCLSVYLVATTLFSCGRDTTSIWPIQGRVPTVLNTVTYADETGPKKVIPM